jgi:hypothetical protein
MGLLDEAEKIAGAVAGFEGTDVVKGALENFLGKKAEGESQS